MPAYRSPRGTRDLLPDERATWTEVERTAADLAARYGYREMEVPIFERAEVFERGVGEGTDVVEKEMFRLVPRTEESEAWALRPEATAGVVRAYIQHGMQTWPQPFRPSRRPHCARQSNALVQRDLACATACSLLSTRR